VADSKASPPVSRPAAKSEGHGESRTSGYLKQAGVILGLISGVVGLLFLLFPGLRPEAPGAGRDESASLSGLSLVAPTTKGQYLDSSDQKKDGFTREQLEQPGAMASFKLTATGYKGKELTLQRQLIDVGSGDVIGETRDFTFEPGDVLKDRPFWYWLPLRPGRGIYVMVFKLFADRDPLAVECKQTEPFAGVAGKTAAQVSNRCPA
jgi:hypothetical protein